MSQREVQLTGGPPWGFRMTGGSDSSHHLKVNCSDFHPISENSILDQQSQSRKQCRGENKRGWSYQLNKWKGRHKPHQSGLYQKRLFIKLFPFCCRKLMLYLRLPPTRLTWCFTTSDVRSRREKRTKQRGKKALNHQTEQQKTKQIFQKCQ